MKRILSLILVFVLMISMVACVAQGDVNDDPTTKPETSSPTTPSTPNETKPSETPAEPSGEYDTMGKVDSAAYFLDEAYGATNNNTMFSPLSLNMALGLVAQGANPQYADLFEALLDEKDYAEFAGKYADYLSELNVDNSEEKYDKYKTVFEIANSLWVDKNYKLTDSYLLATEPFAAKLANVDFINKKDAVNQINKWCAEKTRDMIKDVLSEQDINDDTSMVAVNAVYFESPWLEEWRLSKDQEDFTKFDGTKEKYNPISTTTVRYYENNKATAFGCDYRNGLTFIGILPKETGEFSVQDLDLDSLLKSQTNKYDVKAKMPTLKFNNKINITDILVGMDCYAPLFSPDGIFDNILTDENGEVKLTISKIVQVDAIELDEKGTKAAAVTAIVMDNTAAIIPNPKEVKEVNLNRPFAFIIYDSEMDQIVFIGKVVTTE